MDKFRIDSHKLHYHIPRVNDWLTRKIIYPIYMEVSPSGACNHRCIFCGLDFMEYQSKYLDAGVFLERISELGRLGLKSIMYAGEGEPLLHKQILEIVNHTRKCGIDVAMTTNAVLLNKSRSGALMGDMEWIKVSINAGTAKTYSTVHHTKPADFDLVIKNMRNAARIKSANNYKCALGMQMLLLPENSTEAVTLAGIARDIGMDYLVIKPYSQHPQSKTFRYKSINYCEYDHIANDLLEFNTDNFNVIFRTDTMNKWDNKERSYLRCLALPFWSYIDACGNVWGCSVYLGNNKFLYGNIYDQSFEEIWTGEKRLKSLRWVEEELDPSRCRVNCRMDEVNKYLWDLRNPSNHINFI